MVRGLTIFLVLAALCACATPPARNGPRIVLERSDRPGHWRATYHLAQEVDALQFQRPAAFFRENVWNVVTPGWSFERAGEEQLLVRHSDGSAERLVVEFPEYTDFLAKEYEFFQAFTDRSVAVYTGHLYGAPSIGEQEPDESDTIRRLDIRPGSGERVVVQGEVSEGPTDWTDPHGDGTYVYFGRIAPLETEDMVAIVDPGAPPWLVEQMNAMLPELFRAYSERLGEALPWKPVVMLNFEDLDIGGLSSGGGTLTGLVQLSAVGSGWHEANEETSEQLLYLVAHEAAHLWNAQLHVYADSADSWMHEGSADAFAELALLRAGSIDPARLAERRTMALNECVSGLTSGALTASAERRQYRNFYTCGNLIALWSIAAVGQLSDPDRLYDVWRTMFEHADPQDGGYDRDAYFGAMSALGGDAASLDALRDFLDAEHDDPASSIVELMRLVGVELTRLERAPSGMRRDRASAALSHLMSDACDGRASFYTEGRRFRTAPLDGCRAFSKELRVTGIQGFGISSAGDRAFEAVFERCASGDPVELQLEDGETVAVPCETAPPPCPEPLGFPVS